MVTVSSAAVAAQPAHADAVASGRFTIGGDPDDRVTMGRSYWHDTSEGDPITATYDTNFQPPVLMVSIFAGLNLGGHGHGCNALTEPSPSTTWHWGQRGR
jgi:hypothetical protein